MAVVLTGGGARAAYQVGLFRFLGRRFGTHRFSIVTGVSAGAINAAYLAAHSGSLAEKARGLSEVWAGLAPKRVFRTDSLSLGTSFARWAMRMISGGSELAPAVHSLLDTSPLRRLLLETLDADSDGYLPGIRESFEAGWLEAFAITTLSYTTGQTVTWVQGRDITTWERPHRRAARARFHADHVLASASLPILFPAVRLDGAYYGDGGVRLSAPLAPAIHLGADRILAVSTRYPRSTEEAEEPAVEGYPPPAQIGGVMLNAIFLDMIDQDALELRRINRLLRHVPPGDRGLLRPVDLLVIRPSRDLGRLAAEYEHRLPGAFRFLTRGWGTRQTTSPDLLSLLLFDREYLMRMMEIGEADAEAAEDRLAELLAD